MELRVMPGQAAAIATASAMAVCSINTNFNWKTIQLTKSVKRVGRRESASLAPIISIRLARLLTPWSLAGPKPRIPTSTATPNASDDVGSG